MLGYTGTEPDTVFLCFKVQQETEDSQKEAHWRKSTPWRMLVPWARKSELSREQVLISLDISLA